MQKISSEFVGFVRETGIRAFNRLTTRAKEVAAPLRSVLRAWSKLSDDQKNELLDELIAAVQAPEEAAAPAAKPRKKAASSKKKKQ